MKEGGRCAFVVHGEPSKPDKKQFFNAPKHAVRKKYEIPKIVFFKKNRF